MNSLIAYAESIAHHNWRGYCWAAQRVSAVYGDLAARWDLQRDEIDMDVAAAWLLCLLAANSQRLEDARRIEREALAKAERREALRAVLVELHETTGAERYARAAADLDAGVQYEWLRPGWWSVRRPLRVTHEASAAGCDCPARQPCRHMGLIEGIEALYGCEAADAAA